MKRNVKAAIVGGGLTKSLTLSDLDEFLDWAVAGGSGNEPQDLYKSVAWSYWCANLRADNVAQVPYLVFPMEVEADEDGKEVEWGLDLRSTLWRIEMWLVLKAVAYVLKVQQGRELDRLQVLNPNTMSVKTWDDWGVPVTFEQRVGARIKTFSIDEMLYFSTFDPSHDLGPGISSAEVGQRAGSLVKNANEWAASFFANGAIPAVMLTTDGSVPTGEKERIESVWAKMLQGVQRAFKTVVLERGLKPTVVGQPVKDLAMPELESSKRMQILAAHKIPPSYAEPNANRAERMALQAQLWNDCIVPECEIWIEPVLNEYLFNPLGLRLSFQYRSIEAIQQQELDKAEAASFLITGVMKTALAEKIMSQEEARSWVERVGEWSDMPPLDPNWKPEEPEPIPPQLAAANQQPPEEQAEEGGPGTITPADERIENRLPKATDGHPKATAPEWGRHRVSLQN